MKLQTGVVILWAVSLLAGCGGGSKFSSSQIGAPGTGGGTSNPNGQVVQPTPVTPAAGGTVSGVDISVPSASPPPVNIQVLGVVQPGSGSGFAQSTGATIRRGTTMRVLIFGPGLSSDNQVSISGPSDMSVNTITAITSTKGTPGLSFLVTVDAAAALGARTVIVRDKSDNISTFTGGLEVLP